MEFAQEWSSDEDFRAIFGPVVSAIAAAGRELSERKVAKPGLELSRTAR